MFETSNTFSHCSWESVEASSWLCVGVCSFAGDGNTTLSSLAVARSHHSLQFIPVHKDRQRPISERQVAAITPDIDI